MSKKISVITGASGHVGYALAKELSDQGENFRMLIRSDSEIFKDIKGEKVYGDVTDPKSLEKAFKGAEIVYHLAGVVDVGDDKEDFLRQVNVEGTINVVEACKKVGVRRLVYASSTDAVEPLPGNELMTEDTYVSPEKVTGVYSKTKAEATRYVLDESGDELEAVVVFPAACVGPYDFKISSTGEMVRMIMRGKLPVTLGFGGYNFVDVRDVALGMIGAAKQGKAGESYFLSGKAISAEGIIKLISEKSGRKAPKIKMPLWLANAVAPLAEFYYKVSGESPLFTRLSIEILKNNSNFSYEKAALDFAYNPRSLEESIADSIAWISENEGIKTKSSCRNTCG